MVPLKGNRRVALSEQDKQNRRFVSAVTASQYARSVDSLPQTTARVRIYLEQLDFPLLLVVSVLTKEDATTSALYLVTSDLTQVFSRRKHRLDGSAMVSLSKKRWKIEEYHKSIKSVKTSFHLCNAAFAKSPTRRVRTQSTHFFCQPGCLRQVGSVSRDVVRESFCLAGQSLSSGSGESLRAVTNTQSDLPECCYHTLTA